MKKLPLVASIALLLGATLATSSPAQAGKSVGHFVPVLPTGTHFKPSRAVEAITATPDGKLLLFTSPDATTPANGAIGFIDIKDPAEPLEYETALIVGGIPNSVAVLSSRWAIAVVDKGYDSTSNTYAGSAVVIDLKSPGGPSIARTIELGGQPDSIAISPNGRYAAVTIENERVGGSGAMSVTPAGFLAVIELKGPPAKWTTRSVDLTGLANEDKHPMDPEPEFVAINRKNQAAVTLQENNHVAIVDLKSGDVISDFSAGEVNQKADLTNDSVVSFTQDLISAREPDGIAWTADGNVVIANEGDSTRTSGGRNITIFSPTGTILFDPGAALEMAAHEQGLYRDSQSNRRGAEFNSVKVAAYQSHNYLFASSEKFDLVAVYRLGKKKNTPPEFVQFLRTGDEPEGLAAIPNRKLFITANEDDDTISIFAGAKGNPAP